MTIQKVPPGSMVFQKVPARMLTNMPEKEMNGLCPDIVGLRIIHTTAFFLCELADEAKRMQSSSHGAHHELVIDRVDDRVLGGDARRDVAFG